MVKFVGNLEQGGILIRSRLELHDDPSPTSIALALYLHQALHALQLLLLFLDDLPFHFLRTRPRPYRFHLDLDLLNLRGELDGDAKEGDEPEQNDEENPNRYGEWDS